MDTHTSEVITKTIPSLSIKFVGMIAGVLVSVFLARFLGSDGLGIINLSNRVVSILIIIGLLGTNQIIVRSVAIDREKKNFREIGNLIHSAYWLNGLFSILISVITIYLSPWIATEVFDDPRLIIPLTIFTLALTPQVISKILSSALIGSKKIWQGNLVDHTLSILITGVLLLIFWATNHEISINLTAILYSVGRVCVTICVMILWHRIFKFKNTSIWNINLKRLFKTSNPLFISTLATFLIGNTDILILGYFARIDQVGLYAVGFKIAFLSTIVLQISNSSISPIIANLFHVRRIKEIERMLKRVSKGLFIVGVIQLVVYIFFGKFILSIWGGEFKEAYNILLILSIGQLFNLATGGVGQLLIMAGYDKENRNITLIFLVLNLILNCIFIKYFGITGAAIVSSSTVALLNITRVIVAKNRTGISTI